MTANASTCQIRSMLAEKWLIESIFAENYSEIEELPSDSLTKSSSEEEVKNKAVTRHEFLVQKRDPQTKGLSRASIASSRKQINQKRLEVWKQEDNTSIVHYLAVLNRINAKLSEDPDTIDFINLFLDDGFSDLLTTQTNLYSA